LGGRNRACRKHECRGNETREYQCDLFHETGPFHILKQVCCRFFIQLGECLRR
jgi:hypothetical protein